MTQSAKSTKPVTLAQEHELVECTKEREARDTPPREPSAREMPANDARDLASRRAPKRSRPQRANETERRALASETRAREPRASRFLNDTRRRVE